MPLAGSKNEVIKHLYSLWQFDVRLVQDNEQGEEEIIARCPEKECDLETKKAS